MRSNLPCYDTKECIEKQPSAAPIRLQCLYEVHHIHPLHGSSPCTYTFTCITAAIKYSPEISSYIMNRNGGYIFVGLCMCKVNDRHSVPQCFHYYKFNHTTNNCPNKTKPTKMLKKYRVVQNGQLQVNFPQMHKLCKTHAANSRMFSVLIREYNQV